MEPVFEPARRLRSAGRYFGGMTKDAGVERVADRLLDLAVYAPVGLVLSVVEAVPELALKGRARLGPQVRSARTIGQFAVGQGYRQFVGFATSRGTFPFRGAFPFGGAFPFRGAKPSSTPTPHRAQPAGGDGQGAADGLPAPFLPPLELVEGTGEPIGDIGPESLAIPSYDSLSATQVVERLAGLSRDEVAAVAVYEAATRRRKTILVRAEKLLR